MKKNKYIKIVSKEKGVMLGQKILKATSFFQRLIGLMFQEKMNDYDGLLITPCQSIHTFFMKYNIDAVFMDKSFKVVRIYKNMPPWRLSFYHFGAFQVLELPSGTINDQLNEGDQLEVICLN